MERVDGDLAWVACRPAGCRACDEGRGCGGGIFARIFARGLVRYAVVNHLDARPGERVTLGLDERGLLMAAVRLYGLPVVAMLAGALAGSAAAGASVGAAQDFAALAGGLAGLIVALGYARRRGGRGPEPVLLRRCPDTTTGRSQGRPAPS